LHCNFSVAANRQREIPAARQRGLRLAVTRATTSSTIVHALTPARVPPASLRSEALVNSTNERNAMSSESEILYTAEATVTGGRDGHGRTSDGRLDVTLAVPTEMGGAGGPGTNPEQLFAVGYAACFQSALLRIAAERKVDLTGTRITARVGIGPLKSGGFGLAAALDLDAPQLDRDEAFDLMFKAHEACPYSRATRGNIEVTLSVGSWAAARDAA
jgi:Ohr subfamily peroxiredoxin